MKEIRSRNINKNGNITISKSKNKTLKPTQSQLNTTRLLTQSNVKGLPWLDNEVKLRLAGASRRSSDNKSDAFFDNLITVEELATIFRVAPQTIRNWIAFGKIPHIQIGRRNLFQKRSLQKWLNQKEEPLWE